MLLIKIVVGLLYTLVLDVLPIYIYRHMIHKAPIEPKKAKRIVVIEAIIVFTVDILIQAIISSSNPDYKVNATSLLALVVWGRVNYRILTKGYMQ